MRVANPGRCVRERTLRSVGQTRSDLVDHERGLDLASRPPDHSCVRVRRPRFNPRPSAQPCLDWRDDKKLSSPDQGGYKRPDIRYEPDLIGVRLFTPPPHRWIWTLEVHEPDMPLPTRRIDHDAFGPWQQPRMPFHSSMMSPRPRVNAPRVTARIPEPRGQRSWFVR